MHLDRELRSGMSGNDVALLHQELTQLGFKVSEDELKKRSFGKTTQKAIKTFQERHALSPTGVVNEETAAQINREVDRLAPSSPAAAKKFVISGWVRQEDGTAVVGTLVRVFKVGSAGDGDILGEAKTGPGGSYRLQWEPEAGSDGTDIQVRAFDEDGTTLLAESEVLPGVQSDLTVNLTVGILAKRDFVVKGHVRWEDGGWVVAATVRAFELKENGERLLGETTTNEQGHYEISYQVSGEEGPDLIVRVYDEQGEVLASSGRIDNAHKTEVVHLVATREPGSGDDFVVRGEVRGADGALLVGATVRAFDVDLRQEQQLGEKATDQAGRYEIRYRREQFSRAEKERADLLVHALDSNGEILVASPIIFNAQQVEEVNLMVGGGQYQGSSEYELLVAELTPLVGELPFAQLNEEDVTFLAGETGQDAERITFLAQAHRLARQTDVPAEAFYGMFRQKLPTELPALLAQSSDAQRRALVAAVEENVIPVSFRGQIDGILERLKGLVPGQVLDPPAPAGGSSVADLLGTTLEDEELRGQFASAYAGHTGPVEDFWDDLRARPEFEDKVDDLQFTLQAGALTANHLPLVQKLQSLKEEGEISTARDLAGYDAEEWRQIISGEDIGVPPGVPGEDDAEKAQNYANAMAGVVEDAFPTAVVASRLESEAVSSAEQRLTALSGTEHLLTFFRNNVDGFDFAGTRLQSYLAETPDALDGIPEANRPQVQQQVATMQRLYRVAPRYSQMQVLRDDGLHSAQDISRMGQSTFAIKYAEALGGAAEAQRIYQNAEQVTSTAMLLLADFGMASRRLAMTAVPDTAPEQVEGIPDWQTLFGSLDLCACEHCRSVYSPAAYLVDVLHFLKNRRLVEMPSANGNGDIGISFLTSTLDDDTQVDRTANDVLFERRPDMGQIELTCENTNVPVPYVDLVNEVMEDYVAPPASFLPFALDAELENNLDARELSDDLREAFSPALSEHAFIVVEKEGERWRIEDLPFSYAVRKQEDGQLRVVSRGRQTRGTPQERAANPQYVNQGAYEELRKQMFPWRLPFDLWAEETRAYLEHLGVRRHEVMETFGSKERPEVLYDATVAYERLGLSAFEAGIVTGAVTGRPGSATPGPWNLWGIEGETLSPDNRIPDPANSTAWIAAGEWLDVLAGRVDVFLQQSGLKYGELLELLGTYTANPPIEDGEGRTITIKSTDPNAPDTCELAKLCLEGLTGSGEEPNGSGEEPNVSEEEPNGSGEVPTDSGSALITLIIRFLRLWRKLGWSMRDLDRAFKAFNATAPDDAFLTRLSHVERLREELRLPIDRLLSFWTLIDAAVYVDHDADGPAVLPSLYDRLFRDRAVINPPDPAFTEDPDQLDGKLTDHVPAITAALGIKAADFWLLFESTDVIPRVPDPNDPEKTVLDDSLTLNNLSRLHRHATLAKALRLPVREYLAMVSVVGDPFSTSTSLDELPASVTEFPADLKDKVSYDAEAHELRFLGVMTESERDALLALSSDPNDPNHDEYMAAVQELYDASGSANTVLFVERVDRIRTSGFDVAELGYLLVHGTVAARREGPRDEEISLFLDDLRAGLRDVAAENSPAADPNGELTSQKLALLNWDGAVIERVISTLNDGITYRAASPSLPDSVKNRLRGDISYDEEEQQELRFRGAMTPSRQTELKNLYANADYHNAIDELFMAPRTFVSRNMRTFSVPDYSAPLENLPTGVQFPADLEGRIYYNVVAKELHFLGAMTESERDALLALSNDPAYEAAVQALYEAPDSPADEDFLTGSDVAALFSDQSTPAKRFELVLEKVVMYLRTTFSENLVVQKVGEALQLETRIAERLLTEWADSPAGSDPVISTFLARAFAESSPNVPVSRDAFGEQFDAFVLLHKISLLISKLGLTYTQLGWVFEYGPGVGWLDLNDLPVVPTERSSARLLGWERLLDLSQLSDELPDGEKLLDSLFSTVHAVPSTATAEDKDAAKRAYIEALSTATAWSEHNLEILIGAKDDHEDTGRLEAAFPEDFLDERILLRLRECHAMLARLGMPPELCGALADPGWCGALDDPEPCQQTAHGVKQAVRAKYDEERWLKVAQPLRDVLREKQRAALVAYLLAHPGDDHMWRDTNDVYAYFLLDVEMSPCQMTSRIKQAISSTQLFVQRCLMNLEPEVTADAEVDEKWREWKWMKNYRIWEANRKVFLYPENWIEPELRDDKSPFFEDFENELLQNDITADTAETAFMNYLEKLDAVARLEICGMYHQKNDGTDVLHVFGRTRGKPRVHYYRQRVESTYWTAWEKMDVDIEGDVLIPIVWNRRLHLFWPIFTEETEKQQIRMPRTGEHLAEPLHYWKIELGWSEYKNGEWSAKKIAPRSIRSSSNLRPTGAPEDKSRSRHVFRAAVGGDGLAIWYEYDNPTSIEYRRIYILGFPFDFPVRVPRDTVQGWLFTGYGGEVLPYSRVITGISEPTGTRPEAMMFVEQPESGLYLPGSGYLPANRLALGQTPGPGSFRVLYPHQAGSLSGMTPFFFQDDTRGFCVVPENVPPLPIRWARPATVEPYHLNILGSYLPWVAAASTPVVLAANTAASSASVSPSQSGGSGTPPVSGGVVGADDPDGPSNTGSIAGAFGPATIAGSAEGVDGVLEGTGLIQSSLLFGPIAWPFLPVFRNDRRYRFHTFYHPYLNVFMRELARNGVDGLLQRAVQVNNSYGYFASGSGYAPTNLVQQPYPLEDVDFSEGGGYAQYNWELFFHAPFMIADWLNKNQRFEEAQKWFHYVFDPTDASAEPVPRRYWRTKPFYEKTDEQYQKENIPNLLRFLAKQGNPQEYGDLTPDERKELEELKTKVQRWRKNPFNPHLIARMRTTAYQKMVVMKYIDNLIDWGDQLFRRDTMESINEATQLYVLAAELLGKRPEEIPPRAIAEVHTYDTLEPMLDEFSNALVQIEEFVPPSDGTVPASTSEQALPTLPTMLYFCVPKNDKLLGYWDTVADRLFKIRHCMNIEGVVRQLALFEPPIDPALLVRAAAAGVDIGSALSDVNAALPHYRFNVMVQKANELCAELKSLGSALLSALEKRDAEALALLRSSQEIKVLNAARQVKERQVEEAKQALEGLNKGKELTTIRRDYYANLPFLNTGEQTQLTLSGQSLTLQQVKAGMDLVANFLFFVPDLKVGSPTTIGATLGGQFIGNAMRAYSTYMGELAGMLNQTGSMAATLGGYQRRFDDWKLQERLANKELEQIDKQIAAAEIRKAIAEQELKNHDLQVENAEEADAFMRDKYTNRELYNWMVGQISGVYFQSYQLAYDVAKRAERAYRHELGLQDSSFIQFGYWDNLRKGLLAGERLHHDVKRMEVEYLEQNAREYEVTKHVSLVQLDPLALVRFKQTGECFVSIPEVVFDLDYAGHYMRRIKSVGVSIPCVTGPYTGVNCTLTLLKSSIRHSNMLASGKYAREEDDPRFTDSVGAIQSIVTSSAQNDAGLFEPNLRDERYLPFEGAGAISEWRLDLPTEFRQFDYDTISDVVLHLRYTAREGGGLLKQQAASELEDALNEIAESEQGLASLFSAKHEFSSEWHRFLHATEQELKLPLTAGRFPYVFHGRNISVDRVDLLVRLSEGSTVGDIGEVKFALAIPGGSAEYELPATPNLGEALYIPQDIDGSPGEWTLTVESVAQGPGNEPPPRLNPDAVEDIGMIVHYKVE